MTGGTPGPRSNIRSRVEFLGNYWRLEAFTMEAIEFLTTVQEIPVHALQTWQMYTLCELLNHSMIQLTVP